MRRFMILLVPVKTVLFISLLKLLFSRGSLLIRRRPVLLTVLKFLVCIRRLQSTVRFLCRRFLVAKIRSIRLAFLLRVRLRVFTRLTIVMVFLTQLRLVLVVKRVLARTLLRNRGLSVLRRVRLSRFVGNRLTFKTLIIKSSRRLRLLLSVPLQKLELLRVGVVMRALKVMRLALIDPGFSFLAVRRRRSPVLLQKMRRVKLRSHRANGFSDKLSTSQSTNPRLTLTSGRDPDGTFFPRPGQA